MTNLTSLTSALACLDDLLVEGDAPLPLTPDAGGFVPFAAALDALEVWGRQAGGPARLRVRQAVAALATYAAEETAAGAPAERLALELDAEAGPSLTLAGLVAAVRRLAHDAATPDA